MTWTVAEVEQWLTKVEPIADQRTLFDWLELPPTASATAIQSAYHAIARTRHPDLFRRTMTPAQLDRLVRMYARITAAYAELRVPEKCAAYLRTIKGTKPAAKTLDPAREMSAKALTSYRRAEGALSTGDRVSAMLHLKLAIAADPSSSFLRAALAELQGTKP